MATRSSLTKGVRRAGGRNKSQLECPSPDSNFSSRKGSNQGDSDSDPTLFTSSMHGSTSSATSSTDRYSSGMEGRIRPKKTPDKSNSKKPTGFWGLRSSKKSPSMSLPDDGSSASSYRSPVEVSDAPPVRKPVSKFSRSGSLRSLKIVRNKSRSESKGSTAEDLRSKRATFSSTLKDSKFPEKVEPQVGGQESEEIFPVAKLCPYQHCSLHGHHHHHEPPVKRFSFLKRRSPKEQKGVNPKIPATIDKKKEVKVTKKGSNVGSEGKKKEKAVDFSIEFYEKTRSEPLYESSFNLDDADLADLMFGVNGNNKKEFQKFQIDDQESSIVSIDGKNDGEKNPDSINGNKMSMWRLIHRNMVSGLLAEPGSELDQNFEKEKQSCTVDPNDSPETKCSDGDDAVNQENDNQKMFAIKIVREAIEKILLPEVHDNQDSSERDDKKEPNLAANDLSGTEKERSNGWSDIKKVVLLRRFITELEKAKKFDPNNRKLLPLVPESEAETVSLRRKTVGEKKNSDWMLDYALQQVISGLAPNQKRKVALLVKAFESVTPNLDDFPANNDRERISVSVNGGDYKKFYEKGVEAFDQKGNSKIDSVMKSERRAIKESLKLDVSELEKEKYIKMWHMIYQHVVADITSKVGSELLCDGDEEEVNDWNIMNEFSPRDADKLIRQSVNKILVPSLDTRSLTESNEVDGKQQTSKNWSKLRKLILLRKSIKALESSRKPKPQSPQESIIPREAEGEKVDLRRQMSHEKTKAEQWMIDYAVQHIVTKLTPARKKRVSMLVEAFEAVIPLPET